MMSVLHNPSNTLDLLLKCYKINQQTNSFVYVRDFRNVPCKETALEPNSRIYALKLTFLEFKVALLIRTR